MNKEINDDELIVLIAAGDTHAEALLCEKYWGFAKIIGVKYASLYSDLGFTADEFTEVAFSSLVIALQKYKPNQEKSFYSYWKVIAKNQCLNYVRDNSFSDSDFERPLSLDSNFFEDGLTLHETTGSQDHSMAFSVEKKQLSDYIFSKKSNLNNDEKIIAYFMFIEGYNYDEIRELTKWKVDKVYRIVNSARKKVSNFFKSGYFNK